MDYTEYNIPAVLQEDIERFSENCSVDLSRLEGMTILITGATGVIGYNLIHMLLYYSDKMGISLRIIASVRDRNKSEQLFGQHECLEIVVGDIREPLIIDRDIDFVVHAASITSSRMFVGAPVDVIETSIIGTDNILRLTREKNVKKFVYLSTMEVYGTPQNDERINECYGTDIDTMKVRSSYPESKRLCESLCTAYMKQYGVPVTVLRLTQTFGTGVRYDDSRVFAEFARCALEKRDIILHTDGGTKRSYLYSADAVHAILIALLKGVAGEAYNVANEDTYSSIYDMAVLVSQCCANGKIQVRREVADTGSLGYAPKMNMNLDCSKIRELGWKPHYSLEDMFGRLCEWMKSCKNL